MVGGVFGVVYWSAFLLIHELIIYFSIIPLMESLQADYTIFWRFYFFFSYSYYFSHFPSFFSSLRELSKYPELYLEGNNLPEEKEALLSLLENAFYTPCAMYLFIFVFIFIFFVVVVVVVSKLSFLLGLPKSLKLGFAGFFFFFSKATKINRS